MAGSAAKDLHLVVRIAVALSGMARELESVEAVDGSLRQAQTDSQSTLPCWLFVSARWVDSKPADT